MMRRTQKRKGYTLLEVVVVSIVTSLLFLLGARWVYSLTTAANAPILGKGATEISYSLDKLENDIRLSQSCDVFNQASVIHEISSSTLSFTLDADADAKADKVFWRLQDGNLQRALVMGSDCNFNAPDDSAWATLAPGVKGDPDLFQALQGGQLSSLSGSKDCLTQNCELDGIDVDIASTSSKASTTRTILLGAS